MKRMDGAAKPSQMVIEMQVPGGAPEAGSLMELAELAKKFEIETSVTDAGSMSSGANGSTGVTEVFESTELAKQVDRLEKLGLPMTNYTHEAPKPGQEPEPPYTICGEQQAIPVLSLDGLVNQIRELGKKGMTIQRYKGLGEMNPEQLWETTMDPEQRTIVQVVHEDAVEADRIFTVLMGDQVEPRREFIENNALNVSNLDV